MNKLSFKLAASLVAAAWLGVAGIAAATTPSTNAVFVYKGNAALSQVNQFEVLLGRKVDGVIDFIDCSSPDGFSTSAAYTIQSWKGSGYALALGLPLAMNSGATLANVAAGTMDAKYQRVAQLLVQDGFANAYIRLGWEFNGGWYPWAASGKTATFIAAFQHVVNVMRAVPGSNLKFVWNTALGAQQVTPSAAYPGDSYVDLIATDAYNESWSPGYTVASQLWNSVDNDPWSVKAILAFAKQHGKPYAFPEWGTGTRPDGHGGGDDANFVANMTPMVKAAAFSGYWDYSAADYNARLSGAPQPAAMAAFMRGFGTSSAGSASSYTVEKNTGVIMSAHSAPYSAATLSVTASGCAAVPVQNAPNHWIVIVNNAVSGAVCTVSWGSAQTVNLYDPAVGTSAVRSLPASSPATLTVAPGASLLVAIEK